MGEPPHQRPESDFSAFARRWLTPVVAVFLRAVHDPVLALDLATETLAAARLQWELAPAGGAALGWVLGLGKDLLAVAADRGRVPAAERRRGRQPAPRRLSVAEQRELTALAEQPIELPAGAREAAEALARTTPAPHLLAGMRPSGLIQSDPIGDDAADRDPERDATA